MSKINNLEIFEYRNNFERYMNIKSLLISGEIMKDKPLFSIVIPTYNRKELSESLLSAISQEYVNFTYEIIVIDNNPEESVTNQIVLNIQNDKVLYFKNCQNIGMIGNWNRGVELANGLWICFLHDDDLLSSDFLINIKYILDKKPDIYGICSNSSNIGNLIKNRNLKVNYLMQRFKEELFKRSKNTLIEIGINDNILLGGNPYGVPSCGLTLKKEKIIEKGGFNESYFPYSDWFFLMNFNIKYKLYKPIFITGYYRWEVNESLKISTLSKFIKDAKIARYYLSKLNILGSFVDKHLGYEQHLNLLLNAKRINSELNLFDFNDIYLYKGKTMRFYVYNLIKFIYWRFKVIISLIR